MKIRCLNCMKEYEDEFELCPHCGFVRGTPPEDAYMLAPGTTLSNGRYVIGTAIGVGGFAITYKAWDTRLETMVAIKEYYPDSIVNRVPGRKNVILCGGHGAGLHLFQENLRHFMEEARNTVKFNQHENIVHVYDFFEENQTAYYTMEYMEGVDLSHYLRLHGGSIDVEDTITILLSVIQALKTVHQAGIIHRDISPDNIFICKDGKVKLFDFGAARFSAKEDEAEYDIVVKPGYAPPEQYERKSRQGPWTDIYALGATMYRAITGVLPMESVKRRDEGDEVKRPREIKPEIPEYIDACLTRAMSLEPAFRFKTIEQFEEVLLSKRTVRSESEEQSFRKKVRLVTVSVASVLILIGASIGYGMYHAKEVEANLEPADIVVWIPVAGEEERETVISMYQKMSQEYQEEYQDISIEFIGIPEESYSQQLENPPEGTQLPTLYRSDMDEDGADLPAVELDEVLELLSLQDYYFLKQYEIYFPAKDQLPLGFSAPVVYGNIHYVETEEQIPEQNDKEAYLKGEAAICIGDSCDYYKVQQTLPGVYAVMPVQEEAVCSFTDCWSINGEAKKAEIAAARRLLYYWLGETAQDVLHIRNVNALPLNRAMAQEYFLVNGELDFLAEDLKNMTVDNRTVKENTAYYQQIYEKEFIENTDTIAELWQWLTEE